MSAQHPRGAARVLLVRVKPRSRTSVLSQRPDGTWIARVKAPAIEGRANEALIALVAEHFQCPKAEVSIKSGAAGRIKVLTIASSGVR